LPFVRIFAEIGHGATRKSRVLSALTLFQADEMVIWP